MKMWTKAATATLALMAASQAHAANFVFSSGFYSSGITSPNPLAAGDTLDLATGNNKVFDNVVFTNQSGIVNWTGGSLFLQTGAAIINQSLWNMTSDNSLNYNGGNATSFTTSGIFRKSGGLGASVINGVAFVNSGIIDAQTGSIDFNGGMATFNAGSAFTGAGQVNINSNATFNGALTSANLDFEGGTFDGNSATLTGSANWVAGTFRGGWSVTAGSTLNALSGNNKILDNTTFTNDGQINWTNGNLFLQTGAQLVNNGLIDFTSTQSLNYNGGNATGITNSATGLLHVSAGNTITFNNIFTNNGSMLTADGTFAFNNGTATFNSGTTFNGAGINAINSSATFNGTINSSNLDFNGGTFVGNSAVLNGSADWAAGTFNGGWTVAAGSTLNAVSGNNKILDNTTFTNDGQINWTNGNLFLQTGAQLVNNSQIDFTSTQSINYNGGNATAVINNASGVLTVNAGNSLTFNNALVNNGGTLTADGTFAYNNGTAIFNNGTIFNGAGTNAINSSATFNGNFSSTNVDFNGGTFTGANAVLNGSADWNAGTFTGTWKVAPASTLNVGTGNNKILDNTTFTNDGQINWTNGNLFLQTGAQIVNNGTLTAQSDNSINYNGGNVTSLVNNGLIEKTAGAGTTTLANGVALDNNGTINVLSGTIALPNGFSNDGTLGGTGTFASSALTNNGSIAPGAPGSTGSLTLTGNYIQGASGSLNSQLASTAASDLFNISGTASLTGTLALSCILSCAINNGDSFILLDSIGSLTGTFSNVTTAGFLNGFTYNIFYNYTDNFVRLDIVDIGMAPPTGGVPEPASWALMIAGFGLVGAAARRRSKVQVTYA
jgi:hypothetical protein